jgi:preprotein translocase subunit SecG
MYGFLLILHILVCFSLVLVILLQSGKGGGLAGGAFGGTAQTVFGGRGATDFLTRATMVLAAGFFLTSIALAMMSSGTRATPTRSLLQEQARKSLPATPQPGQQAPSQTNPSQAPPQAPPSTPAPSGNKPAAPATPPSSGGR